MRIVASQVTLSAATSVTRSASESTQGRFWIGERPAADGVQISSEARANALSASTGSQSARALLIADASQQNRGAANGTRNSSRPPTTASTSETNDTAAADDDAELLGSPDGAKLMVMRRLIEAMTGRKVRLVRSNDMQQSEADHKALDALANQAQAPTATSDASNGNERAGWGLELDIVRTQVETTAVDFSARGSIVTEDGKVVTFEASFIKQSEKISIEKLTLRAGDAQLKDPLVLLYSGTHAELTQQTQAFDLDANGSQEQLPGLANGAYVVQDLNGNGRVDDGKELLGALSGDGFADLAAMDEDGNGFVDAGDSRFNRLYLWQPGRADVNSLTSLADAEILGLFTGKVATPFDLQSPTGELSGRVRTTGIYVTEDGIVRPLEQIDVKA